MKIATIDIGSNSTVLLIATLLPDGRLEPENEYYATTRMGRNMGDDNTLSEEAIGHAIAVVKELKATAEQQDVENIFVTATSAVRSASNKKQFLVKCYQDTGIFPQVLSGAEEAQFTFDGATVSVDTTRPIVTIDIGGGSTEVAWGKKDAMEDCKSLDVGFIHLNEKFSLGTEYLLHKRMAAARKVRKALAPVAKPLTSWLEGRKSTVVASGGMVVAYGAIQLAQQYHDRNEINLIKGHRKELAATSRKLARMSVKERKRVPGMPVDRAEEILAALLILNEFLGLLQFKRFVITTNGLRVGVLKHYAANL